MVGGSKNLVLLENKPPNAKTFTLLKQE